MPAGHLRCPGRGGAGRVITRDEYGGGRAAAGRARDPAGVTGVIAGAGFQCVTPLGIPEGMIPYRNDNGAWLNVAGDHAPAAAGPAHSPGMDVEVTPRMAAGGLVDLKLGHYSKDGIEVVDVEGEIDIYTAPRLRELLIDLASKNNYQLIVNLEKVGFLDSTGLGVLVGGLKRVRAHDGSLDLVCTQQRILKIFRITGLTEVFGIYETVDQAIAVTKGRL
jgi:anti-sigma B factor antagonist